MILRPLANGSTPPEYPGRSKVLSISQAPSFVPPSASAESSILRSTPSRLSRLMRRVKNRVIQCRKQEDGFPIHQATNLRIYKDKEGTVIASCGQPFSPEVCLDLYSRYGITDVISLRREGSWGPTTIGPVKHHVIPVKDLHALTEGQWIEIEAILANAAGGVAFYCGQGNGRGPHAAAGGRVICGKPAGEALEDAIRDGEKFSSCFLGRILEACGIAPFTRYFPINTYLRLEEGRLILGYAPNPSQQQSVRDLENRKRLQLSLEINLEVAIA